jgi:hypothetical protein
MSTIILGSTVSMLTVATPSTGWLLGYDTDGFLKQKDSTGLITQIGVGGTVSFSSGTPSLVDVLQIGNTTGTYSIQLGTGSSISTSNGNSYLLLDSLVYSNYAKVGTFDISSSSSVDFLPNKLSITNGSVTNSSVSQIQLDPLVITQTINEDSGSGVVNSFQIVATPSYYHIKLNDATLPTNFNVLETGSTYDSGSINKLYLHINSPGSSTINGVANSVIIGGQNIIADENDTVYLPQVIIRDGDRIKAGAGYGLLEFNQYNDAILSTNKLTDNSIIGIFSSTSSSTHISGKNGILVRDTLTSSTSPSWQSAVTFISTEFSSVDMGVYNSVIVGGNNLSATQSNTVYLGNNVNINNSYYLPTSDGSNTQVLHTDGSGNLYWNTVTAQISTFSLHDVLVQQNDSIDRNIIMGTGTYIESGNSGSRIIFDDGLVSGNIVISTNNGSLFDSYIDMDQSDITISTPNILNLNFNDASIVSNGLKGLEYGFDYSATFVTHSLVDKNYVDTNSLSSVDNTSIELNINNEVSLKSSIDGNRQFNDSVTILGDLIVQGTTSTIYTENLLVEDNFITLNATYSGPAIDAGIEVNLGDGTYSKIFWSSSSQYWNAGLSGSEQTIVSDATNGLSQTDNKIGLGGPIINNTQIYGQGYDLNIFDVGGMTLTASSFIDNKVYSTSTNTSQQFNNGSNYFTRVDDASGTSSAVDITAGYLNIYSFDGVGYSAMNFHSQDQALGDGSINNRIIVADDISQKGIVYRSDYTANFTTYSLVTKGYVDSVVSSVGATNGLVELSNGVIGIGGTLSQNTIIYGQNYDLELHGLNTILMTASQYIDETVNDGAVYSQNYVEQTRNTMWTSTIDNGTYSRVRTTLSGNESNLQLSSYGNYGSSTVLIYSTGSNINDGSGNNSIVVTDLINQKGIVYSDDYSSNFTTYSLVTKGYVDSSSSLPSNGLSYVSSGVIGLGGTLSQNTTVQVDNKNLSFLGASRISLTSSAYFSSRSQFSNSSTLLMHGPNTLNFLAHDISGGLLTYGLPGVTASGLVGEMDTIKIESRVGTYSSIISTYAGSQAISDGSINNTLIVVDNINNKGIVYDGNYVGNFTTYSLVTKGYVDSVATRKYSTTQTFTASVVETINHNLGTDEVIVQCYDSSGVMVIPGTVQINGTNDVDITFSTNITNIKIVVIG